MCGLRRKSQEPTTALERQETSSFFLRLEKPYELSKGHCQFLLLKVGILYDREVWILMNSVPGDIS